MNRLDRVIVAVCILIVLIAYSIIFINATYARDLGQWANQPQEVRDWYRNAQLTPAAQERLHFKSCCDNSDVIKTKFRVGTKGDDVWEYLNSNGEWEIIPADIIHWGESAPDGQPTLFIVPQTGILTCFYPGESGN